MKEDSPTQRIKNKNSLGFWLMIVLHIWPRRYGKWMRSIEVVKVWYAPYRFFLWFCVQNIPALQNCVCWKHRHAWTGRHSCAGFMYKLPQRYATGETANSRWWPALLNDRGSVWVRKSRQIRTGCSTSPPSAARRAPRSLPRNNSKCWPYTWQRDSP